MVSVCVLSYNHEKCLRQCLEGIFMQKVSFPIEVRVHDDASTDRSQEIIKEYQQRYSDILKPILQSENQFSKGGGILNKFLLPLCEGKYIALCEGDDYWTDPLKLQKQVAFLEGHEEYSMCFHAADVKYEGGGESPYRNGTHFSDLEDREYTSTEVVSKWMVPTASIVYRRALVENYQIKHPEWLVYGDIALTLKCSHTGKIFGMSDVMSVYRIQPNSLTNNPEYVNSTIFKLPNHYRCLRMNFPKVEKGPFEWCISYYSYVCMKKQNNPFLKLRDFFMFVWWDPKQAVNRFKKVLQDRMA